MTKTELTKVMKTSLAGFDFKKVHDTMKALNWEWIHDDGLRVPSIKEMEKSIKVLFNDAYENYKTEGEGYTASGGFEVQIDETGAVLRFVVEDIEVEVKND